MLSNVYERFKNPRKALENKFETKGFNIFIIMQVCDYVQKDDDFNIF